jgi:hypothetical protein
MLEALDPLSIFYVGLLGGVAVGLIVLGRIRS